MSRGSWARCAAAGGCFETGQGFDVYAPGKLGFLPTSRQLCKDAPIVLPNMAESLVQRGELVGHAGWVTSISTPLDPNSDIILSSSRCGILVQLLS